MWNVYKPSSTSHLLLNIKICLNSRKNCFIKVYLKKFKQNLYHFNLIKYKQRQNLIIVYLNYLKKVHHGVQ